jgi:hypothetical protein
VKRHRKGELQSGQQKRGPHHLFAPLGEISG